MRTAGGTERECSQRFRLGSRKRNRFQEQDRVPHPHSREASRRYREEARTDPSCWRGYRSSRAPGKSTSKR